ncbi:DUF4333 domain-containing protein, partial [Mycobacterium adipatum]|uniref:DUF4333 domain-containing protein n=1 Tax=Mycobacterium adipatum TaxID=1682113 RepID=UPI0034E0A8F6
MRIAVSIVLAALALVVSGCGSTIKPEGAAQSVTDLVSKETGFTPKDVACPDGVKAEAGTEFECTFTGPDGDLHPPVGGPKGAGENGPVVNTGNIN